MIDEFISILISEKRSIARKITSETVRQGYGAEYRYDLERNKNNIQGLDNNVLKKYSDKLGMQEDFEEYIEVKNKLDKLRQEKDMLNRLEEFYTSVVYYQKAPDEYMLSVVKSKYKKLTHLLNKDSSEKRNVDQLFQQIS